MATATLTFDLADPDDQTAHEQAIHGADWETVVWELDQQLRAWLKYGHPFADIEIALDRVREQLHELKNDRGLAFAP